MKQDQYITRGDDLQEERARIADNLKRLDAQTGIGRAADSALYVPVGHIQWVEVAGDLYNRLKIGQEFDYAGFKVKVISKLDYAKTDKPTNSVQVTRLS